MLKSVQLALLHLYCYMYSQLWGNAHGTQDADEQVHCGGVAVGRQLVDQTGAAVWLVILICSPGHKLNWTSLGGWAMFIITVFKEWGWCDSIFYSKKKIESTADEYSCCPMKRQERLFCSACQHSLTTPVCLRLSAPKAHCSHWRH